MKGRPAAKLDAGTGRPGCREPGRIAPRTRRRLPRHAPLLAIAAAALLWACSSTPRARVEEPGAPGDGAEPAAPAGETATGEPGAASEAPPGGSGEVAETGAGTPNGPTITPEPTGGTRIVVPTARERAIQKALAAAAELVPAGDADALLSAASALVDSGAITLPEGAALASRALERFLAMAPQRLKEIAPIIERAHALVPATARSYEALAQAYVDTGRFQDAESAANAGLTLEPSSLRLLYLRARVLVDTDRWFQAQKPLDTLLKEDPQNADGLLLRATILWKYERDSRTAMQVIQDAFTTHPGDLRFPELQGRILYDEGRTAEARLVMKAVLAQEPDRQDIVRFLLDDAVSRSDWPEASALLGRLPAPRSQSELLTAHTVARGLGDAARAVELAAELDAGSPDRRYAPLHVRSLLAAGARAEALALIADALSQAKEGKVRSELYYLKALSSGEPLTEEAVRDLQLSLAENTTNTDAIIAMARYYYLSGQARKARQYASSALRDRPEDPALLELLHAIEQAIAGQGG